MSKLSLCLMLIFTFTNSTLFSVPATRSICFSDFFRKNEQYLVKAKMNTPMNDPDILLTLSIGSESDPEFNQKEFSAEDSVAILPFTSNRDNEFPVCLVNHSSMEILMELTIKSTKEFDFEEESPTVSQFDELNELSREIASDIEDNYLRWVTVEKSIKKMIDQGTSFETKTTAFSGITLVVIAVIGFVSTYIIKKELKRKRT